MGVHRHQTDHYEGKYTIRGKQKYIWPCFCGSWELAIYLLVGKQQTWSQRQSCCIFVWDGSQQSWFNWEPQKLHGLDYSVPERVVGHDVLQKGWNNANVYELLSTQQDNNQR